MLASPADSKPKVTSNGVTLKSPIGKTGVYLGWISDPKVFRNLTPEQKAEREAFANTEEGRTLSLKEYNERQERKRKRNNRRGGKNKKLKEELDSAKAAIAKLEAVNEQVQIASLLSGSSGGQTTLSLPPPPPPPTRPPSVSFAPGNQAMATAASIQSILRRSTPPTGDGST